MNDDRISPTFPNAWLCAVTSQREISSFQSWPMFPCWIWIVTLNQPWSLPSVQRRVNWSFYIAHRRECELCVSLHVSPVMNYSFPRVYSAIISRIPVYSAGQAILWLWCGLLMLKIVLTTWFKSGFCFSTHYDIWNQHWAQYHFINVCFCVWKSTH